MASSSPVSDQYTCNRVSECCVPGGSWHTDLFRLDFYSPHQAAGLPREERDASGTDDAKKHSSSQPIRMETNVKPPALLDEIAEYLDASGALPNCKVVGVVLGGPDKVECGAEGLLPPR